jgi:hypothetical protein
MKAWEQELRERVLHPLSNVEIARYRALIAEEGRLIDDDVLKVDSAPICGCAWGLREVARTGDDVSYSDTLRERATEIVEAERPKNGGLTPLEDWLICLSMGNVVQADKREAMLTVIDDVIAERAIAQR